MYLVIVFSYHEGPLVTLMECSLIAEHAKGQHFLCKEIPEK